MKTIFCFAFICLFFFAKGQTNLVPNGSFESFSQCPNNSAQLNRATYWLQPTGNTPDYFNACANPSLIGTPYTFLGFQPAHTGNAYSGLCLYYACSSNCKEYIEVPLTTPLLANKKYLVSFWVSLADSSYNGVTHIGAYFSPSLIDSQATYEYLPYVPQIQASIVNPIVDTVSWVLISDTLFATGNESYMVIGAFVPDSLYSVQDIRPNPLNMKWAYYYIDDVSVIDCDSLVGVPEYARSSFSSYPNPSNGSFNLKGDFPANAQLYVFNLLGEEMNSPIELPQGNQSFPFSVNLAEGIYVCRIIAAGEILHEEKLVIVR